MSRMIKQSPRSANGTRGTRQDITELASLDVLAKGPGTNGNGHRATEAIDLLSFGADDNGNAEAMRALYHNRVLFCPAYGWMEYTGTHWEKVSEAAVASLAVETLKARAHAALDGKQEAIVKAAIPTKRHVSDCVWLFKSYVIVESVDSFDVDPDVLNCLNGVVNLRTGGLFSHSYEQKFTYCVPVAYDPQADMSEWVSFIQQAIDNTATVDYLQRCAGYSLTGHTREEKLFYLFGESRAGKGTFSEALLNLLPSPLGHEVDFNSFTAKRDGDNQNFDLAALKPARMVVASESNRYQSLNPAKIKQVTGGNLIHCAFKHKDMFEYRPQFKVWLVSNHEVNADADDTALWGRVQVIVFPHSHLGKEDTSLKERLKSPESAPGVLRWLVEGAMLWYKEGRLTPPAEVINATQVHRDKQDYTKQWLDESEIDETWVSSADLMKSYKSWCEESSNKPLSSNHLAYSLKRFGFLPKRQAHTGKRGYTRVEPDRQPPPAPATEPPALATEQGQQPGPPAPNASSQLPARQGQADKKTKDARNFLAWLEQNKGYIQLDEVTGNLDLIMPAKYNHEKWNNLNNTMNVLSVQIRQEKGWPAPQGKVQS